MYFGLENRVTIVLFIISILIVSLAQSKINHSYKKHGKIKCFKNISGQEAARIILDANGLNNTYVVETNGKLTDHYDPTRKVIKLSKKIFEDNTIASVAVAAHEVGHAIQDKEGYTFMKIRAFLVPIINFITNIGSFVAVISLLAGITGYLKISMFIILAALLFQLITLPVEFDASRRAKEELKKLGIVSNDEMPGVSDVLSSAALTYVASFISSLLNLLRMFIMLRGRDD